MRQYHWSWVTLTAFVLFFGGTALLWAVLDTAPPWWDQSWYLEWSLHLHRALVQGGPLEFFRVLQFAFDGQKAPLISVLPIPLYLLFGEGEIVALGVNVGFIALSSVCLFLLARDLFDENVGLLSVLIFQTMPMTVDLSREFLVDYGLAALVTTWLLLLIRSKRFQSKPHVIGLGIGLGLGLLMKVTFPLFIAASALFVICQRVRADRGWSQDFLKSLFLTLLLGALIASVWYARNFSAISSSLLSRSFGAIAATEAASHLTRFQEFLQFWRYLIHGAAGGYVVLLLLIFGSVLIIRERHHLRRCLKDWRMWFVCLWFLVPLAVGSVGVAPQVRYIYPALIPIAITLAWLIPRLFPQHFFGVSVALFLLPFLLFLHAFFPGSFLPDRRVSLGPFVLWDRESELARKPVRENWLLEKIVRAAYEDVRQREISTFPIRLTTTASIRHFNHNNLRYVALLNRIPVQVASANLRDPSETAYEEMRRWVGTSDYFLSKSGEEGQAYDTYHNDRLREDIEEGRLPFTRIQEFDLPDGSRAVLWRRGEGGHRRR